MPPGLKNKPSAPRARAVSYARCPLFVYKVLINRVIANSLEKARHFFLNASDQNFELAILFNIINKSVKYVFEVINRSPTALRASVVSYALGA